MDADDHTEGTPDDLALLEQLEADLAAVESAIEQLERLESEPHTGDVVAAIERAVPEDRFPAFDADRAPSTGT